MIAIFVDAKQFNTVIANRSKTIKDATKPLKEIGIRLGNKTLETFKNEGARDGHSPWQELKESTANAKFRIATSKKERAAGMGLTKSKKARTVYEKYRDTSGKLIKQKRTISNRRGHQNILHPVGTLMKSFKVWSVNAKELIFGSKLKVGQYSLGAIHQLGIGRNPIREIIFYTRKDLAEIKEVFSRWAAGT